MQATPSAGSTPVPAHPTPPRRPQGHSGPPITNAKTALDALAGMPNLVFKNVADVFASPHIPHLSLGSTPHHISPFLKNKTRTQISAALDRFHEALDFIELEISRAEAVYYREVLTAREKRAEEERKERERREEEKREEERREEERKAKEEEERKEVQQSVNGFAVDGVGGVDQWGAGVFDGNGGMDMGMNDLSGMGNMDSQGGMDGGFFSIYDS